MWSKLKEFLRSAQARSQPALIQAIASALAAITPQDGMKPEFFGFASIRGLTYFPIIVTKRSLKAA
jgi:hypothetical protein